MLKTILAIAALLVAIADLAHAQTPAAKQGWYPRAGDLCAEYVTKMLKKDARFGNLVTPTKDPAIAKYTADFNTANGTDDKGGLALLGLLTYCLSHGAEKLGDVTAQAVLADFHASKANSTTQSAPAATAALDAWYQQVLNSCATDDQCKGIAKKTYDDSIACNGGDTKACSAKDYDLIEIGRWNAQHSNAAAHPAPQDALMRCLQDTATSVVTYCKKAACDNMLSIIGEAQRARCGYSAIQLIQTPQPSQPLNLQSTHCTTTPDGGGGWRTTCAQY